MAESIPDFRVGMPSGGQHLLHKPSNNLKIRDKLADLCQPHNPHKDPPPIPIPLNQLQAHFHSGLDNLACQQHPIKTVHAQFGGLHVGVVLVGVEALGRVQEGGWDLGRDLGHEEQDAVQ
jgi:hypothetical protein